jgi:hypothetical protein
MQRMEDPKEWKQGQELGDTFRKHLKDLGCEISPDHAILVLATGITSVDRTKVIAPKGYHAALLKSSFTTDSEAFSSLLVSAQLTSHTTDEPTLSAASGVGQRKRKAEGAATRSAKKPRLKGPMPRETSSPELPEASSPTRNPKPRRSARRSGPVLRETPSPPAASSSAQNLRPRRMVNK